MASSRLISGQIFMPNYRIVFFDHGGNIYSVSGLSADSDGAAVEKARRIFVSGIGMGFEIRRDGEHVHTAFHTSPASSDGTGPVQYAVCFIDGDRRIIAMQMVRAESEEDALRMAAVLYDACSDRCESYEVWCGNVPVRTGTADLVPPAFKSLCNYAQNIVIEREIALRESQSAIAASKRLLAKLEELGAG